MARRQGPARRGGAARELSGRSSLEVVVHDLGQARAARAAAAELGFEIQLRSAPDAAAYAGVGFLHALGALAGQELLIDCGDDPGLVMAALRTGCRRLAFSGAADAAGRLGDMAQQTGAILIHERKPPAALELAPEDDAARACRAWLPAREA